MDLNTCPRILHRNLYNMQDPSPEIILLSSTEGEVVVVVDVVVVMLKLSY